MTKDTLSTEGAMKNLFFLFTLVLSAESYSQEINWKKVATDALKTIGGTVDGASTRCTQCHAMEAKEIFDWGQTGYWTIDCIDYWTKEDPKKIKTCLQTEDGKYTPGRLGLVAGALDQEYMINAFKAAFPESWEVEHKKALNTASMPPKSIGAETIPKGEWLNLKKWMEKQMIYLDVLMGDTDEYPTACKPFVKSEELSSLISNTIQGGWESYHRTMKTKFFGCTKLNKPLECFKEQNGGKDIFPLTSDLKLTEGWKHNHHPHAKMRFITDTLPKTSTYWFRSSPDGKFIASGVYGYEYIDEKVKFTGNKESFKSIVNDLSSINDEQHSRKEILLDPQYDPDFMPDNSTINMAGGMFCPMSYLKYGNRNHLTFKEDGCSRISEIGLYQSIGMSLDHSDSLAMSGNFASDIGGFNTLWRPGELPVDPAPNWLTRSTLKLFPLNFDGRNYVLQDSQELKVPYDGDWILSKNTKLAMSRTSGWDEVTGKYVQRGYGLYSLDRLGNGVYKPKKIAQFCHNGTKASFSYDDRFVVYHHYVTADDYKEYGFEKDDEKFLELVKQGKSDIWYIDLLEGTPKRISNVSGGQHALFPHVRADGWLYFVVKDTNIGKTILATSSQLIF
jgi:hypothetical protein